MKNIEYLIQILTEEDHDPFDSGGADWEALVHYTIKCPYYSDLDERALCHGDHNAPSRELCVKCKMDWLERERDE